MNSPLEHLITELNDLDRQLILIDGKMMKPSQCFRYETDPLHYMFNTNCPEDLKQQVASIFKKHTPRTGENIIPENTKGKELDLSEMKVCTTVEEAMTVFTTACHRLLHPDEWHRFSGTLSAAFHAPGDGTIFEEGKNIAIEIPGPGLPAGDGFDWVQVDKIVVNGDPAFEESLALRLLVTENPENRDAGVAHFLAEGATSTFILSRKNTTVMAAYYGRNETINTGTPGILNKIRNTAVAGAALAGLSDLQWKKFLKGLLY